MRRLDGRGSPRLDPRRQRHAQPEAVRAEHLPEDSEGSARRAVGAGAGLADIAAGGGEPPQRLRPRQAVAAGADPGGSDQADPDSSCPVRYATTVPTQSLGLLNGEFANEQAAAFAEAAAEGSRRTTSRRR